MHVSGLRIEVMSVAGGDISRSNAARSGIESQRARYAVFGVLVVFCLVSGLFLIRQTSFLFWFNEAGWGDSYVVYDVLHFQKTGVIYRDLSQPPYLPAAYSPMVYIAYSLPGRFITSENPFLGPRLVVITAFLGCVAVVASIAQTLIPVRFVWLWSVFLSTSISSMWNWVLQIRGDFPGIFFSLLAIRLLMSPSGWALPLAGISAGLALQFKITFVAAGAAGALWLLLRRQWKGLVTFVIPAAISSVGFYALYSLREPQMFSQMLAFNARVADGWGSVLLMREAASEIIVPLALLSFPPVAWRVWPRWVLLILFAMTSFAIAAATGVQAGGNANYYFEFLFAAVPVAVFGVFRVAAMARRNFIIGLLTAGLIGAHFVVPRAVHLYRSLGEESGDEGFTNETFLRLADVLNGQRIFSTIPRLALLDPAPSLLEPFGLSYGIRLRTFDPTPIFERISNGDYDVVITAEEAQQWRGIPHIDPALRDAIVGAYKPQCTLRGALVQLPTYPRSTTVSLAQELAKIGCVSAQPEGLSNW